MEMSIAFLFYIKLLFGGNYLKLTKIFILLIPIFLITCGNASIDKKMDNDALTNSKPSINNFDGENENNANNLIDGLIVDSNSDPKISNDDSTYYKLDDEFNYELFNKGGLFEQRNEMVVDESKYIKELINEAPDNKYRQNSIAAPLADIYNDQLFIYRNYPLNLQENYPTYWKTLVGEKEIEVYDLTDPNLLIKKIRLSDLDGKRSVPLKLYVDNDKIYVYHMLFNLDDEVGPKQVVSGTIECLNIYDFDGNELYKYIFLDNPIYFNILNFFANGDTVFIIKQCYESLNNTGDDTHDHENDNNHDDVVTSMNAIMYEHLDDNSGNRKIYQLNIITNELVGFEINHLYNACLNSHESLYILIYEIDRNQIVNANLYDYDIKTKNKSFINSFPVSTLPFPFVENMHYSINENVLYFNFYGIVYRWDFIGDHLEPVIITNENGWFQELIPFDNKIYLSLISGETYIVTNNQN